MKLAALFSDLDIYDPNEIGELPDYKARHKNLPRRIEEGFEYFDNRPDLPEWPSPSPRRTDLSKIEVLP